MKILITGITGMVGKATAQALIAQGHTLVGVVRSLDRAQKMFPHSVEFILWPNVKELIPPDQIQGVDAVIHLMGENIASERWSAKRKRVLEESRVQSTRSLIQSFQRAPVTPKIWLQASAVGIYGSSSQVKAESSTEGVEGYLAQLSKDWEASCVGLSSETRVVFLRIGAVLSTQGGALQELLPLYQKGLGAVVGTGYQWISFIHLDDVVKFILFAIETPKVMGKYNLVADAPVTQAEFAHAIGYQFGYRLGFPAPAFAVRLLLGERAEMVLGSMRIHSERLKQDGFHLTYPTLDKILSAIAKSIGRSPLR